MGNGLVLLPANSKYWCFYGVEIELNDMGVVIRPNDYRAWGIEIVINLTISTSGGDNAAHRLLSELVW